ncbi:MAG: hypothetical protein QOG62_2373 [Thermoleophilaceae bacterium]|jgi:FkbM family methyltransferase|nr:hypothetical protein [Thermoleophilaceae bacterium]
MAQASEDHADQAAARKDLRAQARAAVASRAEFFEIASDLTPYVAVRSGSAIYFVSTTDDHIGRDLFAKQSRKEMRILSKALSALAATGADAGRGIFVDAGAHIGTTSIDALMTHRFASAVALEPDTANLELLRINSIANGLGDRLLVIDAAVSDSEGFSELNLGARSSAKRALATGADRDGAATRRVRTTTLDALAADGTIDPGEVSLVWMDVEGHEGHVLAGAGSLLERRVPVVLEFCPRLLTGTGGLDMLLRAAAEHYTHLVDLKHRWKGDPPAMAIDQMHRLAEDYGREGARPEFTDLLLFALS